MSKSNQHKPHTVVNTGGSNYLLLHNEGSMVQYIPCSEGMGFDFPHRANRVAFEYSKVSTSVVSVREDELSSVVNANNMAKVTKAIEKFKARIGY